MDTAKLHTALVELTKENSRMDAEKDRVSSTTRTAIFIRDISPKIIVMARES